MKKLMTWILLAAMCIVGCAVPAAAEESEAKQRILSDWFDYLYASENFYGDMMWALEAAQKYCGDLTWENRQIAAMVNTAAAFCIEQRNLDGLLASTDDYNLFVKQGADLNFVEMELFSFDVEKENALLGLRNLLSYTEYSAFWSYGLRCMTEEIDLRMQLERANLEYLNITTRYILAQLGEDEQTENFRKFVEEHCPNIHAAWQTEDASVQQLEAAGSDAYKRMEKLTSALEELDGMWQVTLDMHINSFESGDWSLIMENATQIDGLPLMLPDPGWGAYEGYGVRYYWLDAEGKISIPREREAVERVPDGCQIQCEGLARADMSEYCEFLAELGIEPSISEASDESEFYSYDIAGCSMIIGWKNGTGTINMRGNMLCFAPVWYILAQTQ